MRRSSRRVVKAICYNEDKMAQKFNIVPTAKHKRTLTTAKRELGGKPGYRGDAPNKPGPKCAVLQTKEPLPTRNKWREFVFPHYPRFRPNLSPKQVLQMGSFGGTYFRPIVSGVTGESLKNQHKEFPADWFDGLDIKKQVVARKYDAGENKYGVKCGGSLDMWESSGWISDTDPYGWFQWYCRFFLGRRSTDDDRQIGRALGVMSRKGRFRNQLIGRCARTGKAFDDYSVSPVIRQTLQHWGYVLTERDSDAYVKSKGGKLPQLPRPRKRNTDDAGAAKKRTKK